jgi:hypothetical protein
VAAAAAWSSGVDVVRWPRAEGTHDARLLADPAVSRRAPQLGVAVGLDAGGGLPHRVGFVVSSGGSARTGGDVARRRRHRRFDLGAERRLDNLQAQADRLRGRRLVRVGGGPGIGSVQLEGGAGSALSCSMEALARHLNSLGIVPLACGGELLQAPCGPVPIGLSCGQRRSSLVHCHGRLVALRRRRRRGKGTPQVMALLGQLGRAVGRAASPARSAASSASAAAW